MEDKEEERKQEESRTKSKATASSTKVGGSPPKNDHLDGPPPKTKCEYNKHGFCKVHKILAKKIEVTQSNWKERGGGKGYGYVRTKVKKFICPLRNTVPVVQNNYPCGDNHTTSSISNLIHDAGLVGEVMESSRRFEICRNNADGTEK